MASVLVQDIYAPWQEKKGNRHSDMHFVSAGRVAMGLVAAALGAMACLCFYWQQYTDTPLLQFALGVMVFSYSGLLGVYFTAIFTKRGSPQSVLAALISGFMTTLLFQPYIMTLYLPQDWIVHIGFTWQLCIATLVASLVCLSGKGSSELQFQGQEA